MIRLQLIELSDFSGFFKIIVLHIGAPNLDLVCFLAVLLYQLNQVSRFDAIGTKT